MVLLLAQQEVEKQEALAVVAPSEDLRTQGSDRLAPSQKRPEPSQKRWAPSQKTQIRRVGRGVLSGVAFRRRWVHACLNHQEGSLHPENGELAPVVDAGTVQRG